MVEYAKKKLCKNYQITILPYFCVLKYQLLPFAGATFTP